MGRGWKRVVRCGALHLLLVSTVAEAHFTGEREHESGGPTTGADYGADVAVDADATRLVVGSPGAHVRTLAAARGMARVLVRTGNTWSTEAELEGTAPTNEAFLGSAVAIDDAGTRVALGAPAIDGYVHVYHRTGTAWALEAALRPEVPGARSGFGHTLSMSADGTKLAVSFDDVEQVDVFTRTDTSWARTASLTPSVASREFGDALAFSGDGEVLLIGAPALRRVFRFDDAGGWSETAILEPAVRRTDFGQGVAADFTGARVAVGAIDRAYVFTWDGSEWTEESLLIGDVGDEFGADVALSGDGARLVVGVPGERFSGGIAAYLRTGDSWGPDGEAYSGHFEETGVGDCVAIARDGTRLAAGGMREGRGKLYVWVDVGDPCDADGDCLSGFCEAGVCCSERCDATCTSCSAARTAALSGACVAVRPEIGATIVCHPSRGACDPEETCARPTFGGECRDDELADAGASCRPSRGACDIPEVCDGTNPTCPADRLRPDIVTCRSATGPCDRAERCDGVSDDCPPDSGLEPAGTVCRASSGAPCDVAETCDGASATCPEDVPMCVDAGPDAGGEDAGPEDAGPEDAGPGDAGEDAGSDAGLEDAGPLDAGIPNDAGVGVDAGARDASNVDASDDAGTGPSAEGGCACRATGGLPVGGWLLLAFAARLPRSRVRRRP